MNWDKLADAATVAMTAGAVVCFIIACWFSLEARAARIEEQQRHQSVEIYDWCESQFPFRDDLQHSCRLGADEQAIR